MPESKKRKAAKCVLCEGMALSRVYRFHVDNSTNEKIMLWAVTLVWLILEIGTTFSVYTPPESMWWIRLMVAIVTARMWGIERAMLSKGLGSVSASAEDTTESETERD